MSSETSSEWTVRKMSDLGAIVGGGTPASENSDYWGGDILWATPSEVVKTKTRYINTTERKLSNQGLHASSAKIHPVGTLLLTTRASIGYCAINSLPMATNQGFQSLRPNENLDTEFGYYLLTHYRSKFHQLASGSTFLEISATELRNITFPIPPLAEQKKIAEILSSVDEVIENTESEINKLEDLKKATLNELLTKGIGHTEFKETEIGRIPKSWRTVPFGDIVKFGGGSAFSESLQGEKRGDFPFIKVSDMNHNENPVWIVHSENWITKRVKEEKKIKIFPVNAVVFAKVGAALMLNRRRILSRPTAIDNNMMAAVPHGCDSKFLYWLMCRMDFRRLVQDGAVPSVNQSQLDEIVVALPNASEQRDIAVRLDCLASVIEEKNTVRDAMVSVRAGLMQDLLTGKVRV